ncbi:hypothetical protein AB6A40_010262 [Gnathostoma spinigerum]|uniref:Uncharacterized protein n=1 Tax=Gnathostoma spinigerum TaxID=75299 RepID=A0ABD6EUR7_9BILA
MTNRSIIFTNIRRLIHICSIFISYGTLNFLIVNANICSSWDDERVLWARRIVPCCFMFVGFIASVYGHSSSLLLHQEISPTQCRFHSIFPLFDQSLFEKYSKDFAQLIQSVIKCDAEL